MAINFPLNPNVNDSYTFSDKTWVYNGLGWQLLASGNTFATISYVDGSIANVDALPSQTGNSGKYLTTDGTTASWATVEAGFNPFLLSGM